MVGPIILISLSSRVWRAEYSGAGGLGDPQGGGGLPAGHCQGQAQGRFTSGDRQMDKNNGQIIEKHERTLLVMECM